MAFMTVLPVCGRRDATRMEEGYSEIATLTQPRMTRRPREAAPYPMCRPPIPGFRAGLNPLPACSLFLRAGYRIEPEHVQLDALGLEGLRRVEQHGRTHHIDRRGRDGRRALLDGRSEHEGVL